MPTKQCPQCLGRHHCLPSAPSLRTVLSLCKKGDDSYKDIKANQHQKAEMVFLKKSVGMEGHWKENNFAIT